MLNNYKLTLPTKDLGDVEIETSNSLLFVGANGAGKTRLGTWIEFNSPDASRIHKISAQKSLEMPDTSTPTAIDLAENDLLFGNPIHGRQNKIRKDLGHKNNKLVKGTFVSLILRNPELFLSMAKKNPNVTLAQLSEVEQKLQS